MRRLWKTAIHAVLELMVLSVVFTLLQTKVFELRGYGYFYNCGVFLLGSLPFLAAGLPMDTESMPMLELLMILALFFGIICLSMAMIIASL